MHGIKLKAILTLVSTLFPCFISLAFICKNQDGPSNIIEEVDEEGAVDLETLWQALLILRRPLHNIAIFSPSCHWFQIRELKYGMFVKDILLTFIRNLDIFSGISCSHFPNLRLVVIG